MKWRQAGIGGLQVVLAVLVMGVVLIVAVPRYKEFISKSRLTEAYNLAGESREKVSRFLMTSGRLPSTQLELEAMATATPPPPAHVREMALERGFQGSDLAIKVYLKSEAVENPTGEDQFIFMTVNEPADGAYDIEWSCGASGIESELLPEDCRS
jgi:type IV pilus assembly protein PilA